MLDEFALIFHLDDVYWEQEGRKSIDAVVISVVLAALFLIHATPQGAPEPDEPGWALTVVLLVNLAFVVAAALKGKLLMATFGVFVPLLALVGAIRLAEPGSLWARHRYPPGGRRQRRLEARYAGYEERWRPARSASDLIGGVKGRPDQDPRRRGQSAQKPPVAGRTLAPWRR